MHRMLGNQYFMAKKFAEAIPHLEAALSKSSDDRRILKNLIFCYAFTENPDNAVKKLMHALQKDSKFLDEMQHQQMEGPHQAMFMEWITKSPGKTLSKADYLLSTAILALFCCPELAPSYFHKARKLRPDNESIKQILQMISNNDVEIETQ